MIKSMTGFGRGEFAGHNRKFTVEIKSVNHRYLDVNIKMPKKLNYFEASIRTELKNFISRGKVDVFITCEDTADSNSVVRYNRALAEEYLRYLKQMAEEFGLENDVRVSTLSHYPDVFTMEEQAENEDESLTDRTDDTIDLEEDISGQFAGRLSEADLRAMQSFAVHADAEGFMAYLRDKFPPTAAFNFGRMIAEDITFTTPLLAVTCMTPKDAPLSVSEELKAALLDENGNLKYAAEDFLTHVPKHLQGMVSALTGAMIAGSHNSSLIVLDNPATEIIARYTEQLCPAIRPYILHTQPMLLQLGMTTDGGGIACLGLCIIDAALHMLNDMKTFEETSVSIAADGPGAKKQQL